MPEEAATLTPDAIKALIDTSVKDLVSTGVTEAINAYDKGRKKTLASFADDLEALKKSMKPKRFAKMLLKLDEMKGGKAAQTPEEKKIADDAAALAAANGNGKGKKEEKPDLFKKKQIDEFAERITALEATNAASLKIAEEAQIDSALDRALTDFPWESTNSRDLARNFFRPQLKRDPDTNALVIGDRPFEDHIKTEIPAKYENLLASKNKGGAGGSKGNGKVPGIDIDAVSAGSSAEDKNAAAKQVAVLLGA